MICMSKSTDMEEKVTETLKIIDDDGDSFAKRAEMYYRKRPELIAFVEESYKSYRALAERYDHLSRELQSANRKIATAFPEELQFDVDDEDEDEELLRKSGQSPENQPKDLQDGQKARIPKAPGGPGKDFRSPSTLMSRKGRPRQTPSYAKAPVAVPASGLSKTEALEELDKLQKEILSLQTEKEFVKSAFERGKERYWEIEHQITEMQQKVCSLQDEFSIGIVIEDNEARTLMVTTALKSCQEALVKLQERHRQSEEEVKVEDEKIQEAYEKFQTLSGVSVPRQKDAPGGQTEEKSLTDRDSREMKSPSPKVDAEPREKDELELAREKMREEIDAKVSVPEIAEKIDDLVDKVVNLEMEVSSQAALVRRLRLETAVLQAHILSLEKEKENTPVDSTEKMKGKFKEFEEELTRVKNLKQHVVSQCQNLLSQFNEATSNINNLSEKLENLNLDDEVEMTGLFQEARAESDGKQDEEEIGEHQNTQARDGDPKEEEEIKDGRVPTYHNAIKTRQDEFFILSGPSSDFDALSEKPQESVQHDKEEGHDLFDTITEMENEFGEGGTDEQPNWRKLFLNGLEDREKILLEEYTTVLRSYKDVKSKLGEMEKKNRDGLFELAMEIRELRNANAQKEEELEALRQKLGSTPPGATTQDENSNATTSNNDSTAQLPSSSTTTTKSGKQPLYKLLLLHNDRFTRNMKYKEGNVNLYKIGKGAAVPTMEEKLRVEIDELMEENLEFWLRFSTSIHRVQKFQTTFHDLQAELAKLKDAKKQQSKNESSAPPSSEVRPIYKHLREIQTEIKLWFEHNMLLNEELQNRSLALSNIQDEISRVLEVGPGIGGEDDLITEYQAAKFQGEVLNMRQENKKVEDELRIGLDRVKKLQAEIERTLKELDKDLGISASKKQQQPHHSRSNSSGRSRIPLRSFLFGVKLKKQKPSLFSCVNPALQKQYSDMRRAPLPT
ncbi:hypothetical protein CDL15_Pgr011468 [Punica granatum]|uniref:NAB domain-containing protein n=2 Tax=Punica granatum TaxID=22663 RepID=A0A218WFS5_PUNGR|nr:hypothetical protein CDL15_Pgr011468 [Punica granatum]